jgi:hypothetical protein
MTAGSYPFHWLDWSNPVALWWGFLLIVSVGNIALWLALHRRARRRLPGSTARVFRVELMVLLCAAYVFGCAFRSVLPRADVQRICLFDTWLSSIAVGRTVATIAEICFVIQWAIVLRELARFAQSDLARNVSLTIVPLILLAEACSWYAVATTSYLGNAVENSLWAVTFLLIAVALVRLLVEFHGIMRIAIGVAVVGIGGYLAFLVAVDVPMYLARWQADAERGKQLLDVFAGLYDAATRWAVTRDVAHWHEEMPWMALYFSAAVWSSLALASFVLFREHLPRYRAVAVRVDAAEEVAARP